MKQTKETLVTPKCNLIIGDGNYDLSYNYLKNLNNIENIDIYIDEEMDKEKKDKLSNLGLMLINSNIYTKFPTNSAWIDSDYLRFYDDSNILHYTNTIIEETNYRRNKLNKFLTNKYKIDTIRSCLTDEINLSKKYKIAFISDPRRSLYFVNQLLKDKTFIIYDHTDNWAALGERESEEQNYLLEKSNIVFCSSKFLYKQAKEIRKNKPTFFIPNGLDVKEKVNFKPKIDNSAVYIGKSILKIDFNIIENILLQQVQVHFYGVDKNKIPLNIKQYNNFFIHDYIAEDKLVDEITQYNVGLIPFIKDEWTSGMLPLKIFQYSNARLETAYCNCDEVSDYKPSRNLNEENILDIINNKKTSEEDFKNLLNSSSWKKRFNKMIEIIKQHIKSPLIL